MSDLVLIIGGTSGIGLETANYLFGKGYKVVVSGRREFKSRSINFVKSDIKSDQSVIELYNKIKNNYGDVNAIVYSAGITSKKKSIKDFDESSFYDLINTNVTGLLRVLKHFYISLKASKGRVAVVNSIAGKRYSKISGIEYTISKAALTGLVRQLSLEWVDDGILINSVFPSMTLTPMLIDNLTIEELQELSKKVPLNKLAETFDVARAIEFLISSENKYMTGSGIDISGGQVLSG